MKRPILKRIVKTVEIVTWTLEYEDVPAEELAQGTLTAEASPPVQPLPEVPPAPQPQSKPEERLDP
jgi:hypothetical protein